MTRSPENARRDRSQRDAQVLRRRLEVLTLPVLPLRRAGIHGLPPDALRLDRGLGQASAWGIGPGGELMAYWPNREGSAWGAVTRTSTGTRGDSSVVEVQDPPPDVEFVQMMPGGGFLLSGARQQRPDDVTCRIYDANGRALVSGSLGDAVAHVLTTPTGQIWVGHFDENPQGVIRYDSGLRRLWGTGVDVPSQFDCYALNVDGEVAVSCGYTGFHLTRMVGDQWADLGQSPHPGARALLVQGDDAVLVGGYQAEYDLLFPLCLNAAGVIAAGEPRRVVLPDGMELNGPIRMFGRGHELHVIRHGDWFRLDLREILA